MGFWSDLINKIARPVLLYGIRDSTGVATPDASRVPLLVGPNGGLYLESTGVPGATLVQIQADSTGIGNWIAVRSYNTYPGATAHAFGARVIGAGPLISDESVSIVPAVGYGNTTIPGLADRGYVVRLVPTGSVETSKSLSVTLSNDHLGQEFLRPFWVRLSNGTVPIGEDEAPAIVAPTAYSSSAFGQARVAPPYHLADLLFTYAIDPLEWGTQIVGGGTVAHNNTTGEAAVSVTAASGDAARLSTHAHYRYQSGSSQRIGIAVRHTDAGQTNQIRRWGYFDGSDGFGGTGDGLFFQLSGTDLSLVRRTSTGEVGGPAFVIPRASWYDPLDGTGPSGIDLDLTAGNVYEFDLQWSYGRIIVYVNGKLVHYMHQANQTPYPHIRTAILPLRFECLNTGVSSSGGLYVARGSVSSEGGEIPTGVAYAEKNSASITVGATERPLLSFRISYLFKAAKSRLMLVPHEVVVATEGQKAGFSVWLNSTLTGATWAFSSANGGYDWDEAATAFTGGQLIADGFLPQADSVGRRELTVDFGYRFRKLLRRAFAASAADCDTITITGSGKGAGTTLMRAAMSFDIIG